MTKVVQDYVSSQQSEGSPMACLAMLYYHNTTMNPANVGQ